MFNLSSGTGCRFKGTQAGTHLSLSTLKRAAERQGIIVVNSVKLLVAKKTLKCKSERQQNRKHKASALPAEGFYFSLKEQ